MRNVSTRTTWTSTIKGIKHNFSYNGSLQFVTNPHSVLTITLFRHGLDLLCVAPQRTVFCIFTRHLLSYRISNFWCRIWNSSWTTIITWYVSTSYSPRRFRKRPQTVRDRNRSSFSRFLDDVWEVLNIFHPRLNHTLYVWLTDVLSLSICRKIVSRTTTRLDIHFHYIFLIFGHCMNIFIYFHIYIHIIVTSNTNWIRIWSELISLK